LSVTCQPSGRVHETSRPDRVAATSSCSTTDATASAICRPSVTATKQRTFARDSHGGRASQTKPPPLPASSRPTAEIRIEGVEAEQMPTYPVERDLGCQNLDPLASSPQLIHLGTDLRRVFDIAR